MPAQKRWRSGAQTPLPPCSASRLTGTRSNRRIVHSAIEVKSWASNPPSCGSGRPSLCACCGAAGREPGRALVIVGHGLRERTIEGPLAPGDDACATTILTRRYRCRACGAVLVVVPSGVARGYRYSLSAIACALALWACAQLSAAQVRERTSTAKVIGASSATRWASLRRWTQCALALFGIATPEAGTMRERAARISSFVAAHAPIAKGPVPLDAFFGAPFCRPH